MVNTHIISIEADALLSLNTYDIIVVYNSDSVCVGLSQYKGGLGNLGLIAFGDDFTTPGVDGCLQGETMNFKIYSLDTDEFFPVKMVFSPFMRNADRFEENGLSVINKIHVGDYGSDNYLTKQINIYPNPSAFMFNYVSINDIPIVNYIVMDIHGQIVIENSFKNNVTSGNINFSSLSKGMYYIKFTFDDNFEVVKVILK